MTRTWWPVRRLTLRTRLTLLVVAAVLPLTAVSLGGIYVRYQQDRERAAQQALILARGLALAVEGELRSRTAMLQVLALSPSLAAGDLATFRAQAEAALAQQAPGANILLLREDGQQLLNTAIPPGEPLPARQNLDNQRRVFATGQPSVSDVFVGVVLRRPLVALDVPVRGPDGRVNLILALNPTLDAFEPLILRQRPGPSWIVAVLDRAGVHIARVPDPERYVGQEVAPDFLRAWLSGAEDGLAKRTSPEGHRFLTAFARVPEIGWGVSTAVPVSELTGPAWRSALASLTAGLAVLLVGLVLVRWLALGIVRPILDLLGRTAAPDTDAVAAASSLRLGLPEADRLAAAHLEEARRRQAATMALIESERRLRLVVAELNHRAKNALATVQSLALQTARHDGDPARFTEAFTARLLALSRAHDLLTAFSWEGAALGAVVRAGLAPWLEADKRADSPRILLRCPCDLSLPPTTPGQVQALAMALHELADNAARHGALSVPGGRVEVSCHADTSGLTAELHWQECGGPPLAGPPARRGFGVRLIERALVRDLGPAARVRLDFHPDGVRAEIRFAPRAVPKDRPADP
jgi:two-component sensor histidine kinase